MLWYEAGADQEPCRTIGIIPGVSKQRTKLISNQLGLCGVYIASCFILNKSIIYLRTTTIRIACHRSEPVNLLDVGLLTACNLQYNDFNHRCGT
jgi:hypothetical protein